jgi:hypothetical protein
MTTSISSKTTGWKRGVATTLSISQTIAKATAFRGAPNGLAAVIMFHLFRGVVIAYGYFNI